MEYDYSKLRGKVYEVYKTKADFIKDTGLSATAIHNYFNNTTKFNQDSIELFCRLLHIPIEDAMPYFFTPKV